MSEKNKRGWSIVTKSRVGNVSVIRDFTEKEAKEVYIRLGPNLGRPTTLYSQGPENTYFAGEAFPVSDSDIVMREVFGPDDWDRREVQGWHGPESIKINWDDTSHTRFTQARWPI